jgi:hypothetical protein
LFEKESSSFILHTNCSQDGDIKVDQIGSVCERKYKYMQSFGQEALKEKKKANVRPRHICEGNISMDLK